MHGAAGSPESHGGFGCRAEVIVGLFVNFDVKCPSK